MRRLLRKVRLTYQLANCHVTNPAPNVAALTFAGALLPKAKTCHTRTTTSAQASTALGNSTTGRLPAITCTTTAVAANLRGNRCRSRKRRRRLTIKIEARLKAVALECRVRHRLETMNMTSKEMLKTICPVGYWFVNIAGIGKKPNWRIVQAPEPPKQRRATCD